jgi:hypothetical protein
MAPLALQPAALAVFLLLFVLVTVMGFMGSRWRRAIWIRCMNGGLAAAASAR